MKTIIPQGQLTGFIVPRFLTEIHGLSLPAKVLYGSLCDHARDKDFCFPSIQCLANELKASVRSIRNWLKELVAHALIYIEYRLNHSSKFWILKHEAMDAFATKKRKATAEKNFAPVRQMVPEVRQTLPPEETGNKDKYNITPLPPKVAKASPSITVNHNSGGGGDLSPSEKNFEAFWAEYPRKDAYWPARKMWLRMLRQGVLPSMDKLRDCLKRFLATDKWQRDNGRYVPFLVNFLHGRLWLDFAHSAAPEVRSAKDDVLLKATIDRMEKEKAERSARTKAETEALFEPFLRCFEDGEEKRQLATMRWTMLKHLYRKTLTANDVSNENKLGVLAFINQYHNFDK